MDDFNQISLSESKSEWTARLVGILVPIIIDGFQSIFKDAFELCRKNNENAKYLMTFQNFLSRIPMWNTSIIDIETKRIIDKSGCTYLNDLITCVHIIHLKILTVARAGNKQKKVDISIPKLENFIHKIYICCARKIHKNAYLFQIDIESLQMQRNGRELEIIIEQCILETIRESIPVDNILKAYLDESVEEEVIEEIKEIRSGGENLNSENIHNEIDNSITFPSPMPLTDINTPRKELSFSTVDFTRDINNNEEDIIAPKTIERLEEISQIRNMQRKAAESEDEDDNDNNKIQLIDDNISDFSSLGIEDLDNPGLNDTSSSTYNLPELMLDDIEMI